MPNPAPPAPPALEERGPGRSPGFGKGRGGDQPAAGAQAPPHAPAQRTPPPRRPRPPHPTELYATTPAAPRPPPCARSSPRRRPRCRPPRPRVPGRGRRHLAQHVDHLLAPPDEVPRRHLRLAQHLVQRPAGGPHVDRPGETEVGFALADPLRLVDLEVLLQGVQPPPDPHHLAQRDLGGTGRHLGRDRVVGLPCLVHQRRDARGEFGRVEALPHAVPQALAGEQVQLAVEPGQPAPVLRDLVAPEVVHLREQRDDPVEGPGDRVRPPLDPLLQLPGVPLQPVVALGPPRVVLALVAPVARVGAQLGPQPGDLPVVGGGRPPLAVPVGHDVPGLGPQRRGKVAPGLRRTRVERLRDPHPVQRLHRHREVHRGEPLDLPLGGQHQRSRPVVVVEPAVPVGPPGGQPRVQHQRQPRELPRRHVDDVSGLQLLQRGGRRRSSLRRALLGQLRLASLRSRRRRAYSSKSRGGRSCPPCSPPGPPRYAAPAARSPRPTCPPGTGRTRSPAARANGAARTAAPG